MSKQKSIGCLGVILAVLLVCAAIGFLANLGNLGSIQTEAPAPPAKPATQEISDVERASLVAEKMMAHQPVSDEEQGQLKDTMLLIYEDATSAIRKNLKDPADAKFSNLGFDEEAVCGPYGYHQWVCGGWVDGFNSFGAKERIKWGAYVFRSDIAAHVDYMEIGDSIYGQMPAKIPFHLTPEQIQTQKISAAAAQAAAEQKKKAGVAAALKANQSAAEKGDPYGLLRMGERYRDGDGVETNLNLARDYLTKAAATGSIDASNELANLPKK